MENKKYCFDCESELTPDNTSEFEGFDSGNFLAAYQAGFGSHAEAFTKCDDCFNADIDRALENQYS